MMAILMWIIIIAINVLIVYYTWRHPFGKFLYFCILVFGVWVVVATCHVSSGNAPDSWYSDKTEVENDTSITEADGLDGKVIFYAAPHIVILLALVGVGICWPLAFWKIVTILFTLLCIGMAIAAPCWMLLILWILGMLFCGWRLTVWEEKKAPA